MQKSVYYSKKYRMNEDTKQPVENKRFATRKTKTGSAILAACLVLALAASMLVPLLMSGAGMPQASRSTSTGHLQNVSVKEYASASAAMAALGIDVSLPSVLPEGYELTAVNVLDDYILEMVYANGNKEMLFRAASGSDDVSGQDYNEFAYNAIEEAGGISRGYAGVSEKKLSLSMWTNNGHSYAVVFKNGISPTTMRTVAEGIA